jgi:hypothetical protein
VRDSTNEEENGDVTDLTEEVAAVVSALKLDEEAISSGQLQT